MRKLFVIGLGAGNPDHLTLQAIKAIGEVDVFLVPDKGENKADLKAARHDVIAGYARRNHRIVEIAMPERERSPANYRETVADWHSRIAEAYADALTHIPKEDCCGLLVWGDPSLYDSTLRILDALRAAGHTFEVVVIPGISAVAALCASHRIALNAIAGSVVITTGRKLAVGFPEDAETVVVMLDGEQAFAQLDEPDMEIFWGAYLGTADEMLFAGRLNDLKNDILTARAAARARKGWIMDTYMLKKRRQQT